MTDLTVLILAGGQSRRMGADKPWLELDGVALIEHVALRLAPLAAEVLFSAAQDTRLAALADRLRVPARIVPDRFEAAGPLAGLHAGLTAAKTELVFAVAADMPFVQPALVGLLLDRASGCDVVAPLTPGDEREPLRPEPLHALYRKSCLAAIESALNAGRRRLVAFFEAVRVCHLTPEEAAAVDPGLESFRNFNTPEEWAALQQEWLARKGGAK